MDTVLIQGLEIDFLLSCLRRYYSSILEKVWGCEGFVNGVFIHSQVAVRTMSEQSITIIVQHQVTKNECEVTVVCSGGGEGLLRLDFGSERAAESTFVNYLVTLARERGWKLSRMHPGYKGAACPFCSAFYLYEESKIQPDGSVVCQNCNRSFVLEKTTEPRSHKERIV